MRLFALISYICVQVHLSSSYEILALLPYPGISHFDVFRPLLVELANKGNNVTVVGHFPLKIPIKNYHEISLEGTLSNLTGMVDVKDLPESETIREFIGAIVLPYLGTSICHLLGTPPIQNLLKSEKKFDVIINEHFNHDCFLGLSYRLKAPHIGLSSCTLMSWTTDRFALSDNPSYIPNNLLGYSDNMSFRQRLYNTLFTFFLNKIWMPLSMTIPANRISKQHLGDDLPSLDEIARNTSLILVNSHFSLNLPKPLVPGVIEVGGIHLKQVKPLPKDIEDYITNSKDGVIYFSMGSMIQASSFTDEKFKVFTEAFSEFPQRILWKFENENVPNKPKNVEVRKWMPQFDILNHPNVVAFITHAGLLGTIEGVHAGVPMITIPMFGDQFTNSKATEKVGAGVHVSWSSINKQVLVEALKKVLDKDFREKAKRVSRLYSDRPIKPLDEAVYWVEYVARHQGGSHMHTAAVEMPLYQYFLLDVLLTITISILVILYASFKITKFVFTTFRNCCCRKEKIE